MGGLAVGKLRDMRLDPRRSANQLAEVEVAGGLRIAVRNDFTDQVAWTLFEQEDSVEPELSWLRRVVRPGWKLVDIGAGHDIYALSLAGCTGPSGTVLALEDDADRRALLGASVRINGLTNIEIAAFGAALLIHRPEPTGRHVAKRPQDHACLEGTARATTSGHAALAGADLIRVAAGHQALQCFQDAWTAVATGDPILVIALEGIGQEQLAAVATLLGEESFEFFHYVPDFAVAIPLEFGFQDSSTPNLIACRPNRSKDLSACGLLVARDDALAAADTLPVLDDDPFTRHWSTSLDAIDRILTGNEPVARRITCAESLVKGALGRLHDFVDLMDHPARLIAWVRLLAAAGARSAALEALRPLLHLVETRTLFLNERTIPISRHFDQFRNNQALEPAQDGGADPGTDWVALSIVDTMCRLMAPSSYLADDVLYQALTLFRDHPAFSPDLERRRQLLGRRRGDLRGFECTPGLERSRNGCFAAARRIAA